MDEPEKAVSLRPLEGRNLKFDEITTFEQIREYNRALLGRNQQLRAVGELFRDVFPEVSLSNKIELIPSGVPLEFMLMDVHSPTFDEPNVRLYTDGWRGKMRKGSQFWGPGESREFVEGASFVITIKVWDLQYPGGTYFLVNSLHLTDFPKAGLLRDHLNCFRRDFPHAQPFPFSCEKRRGIRTVLSPGQEERRSDPQRLQLPNQAAANLRR
jgi:hypothetical protein